MLSLWRKLAGTDDRAALRPLYDAVVAHARLPHWYREGAVPDSVTGRFDMLATLLALVLVRLERDARPREAALLAELFIADMDGQLREFGVGDVGVGKQIGKLMGTLGGRRASLLDALGSSSDGSGGDLDGFVARNIHRGEAPSSAVAHVASALRTADAAIAAPAIAEVLAGRPGW